MAYYREIDISRYTDQGYENMRDIVVEEYPLTLFVNGREFVTLLCSPEDLEYLVIGFLFSEGFIKEIGDLDGLVIKEREGIAEVECAGGSMLAEKLYGSRTITSGCGRGPVFYNVKDSMDTHVLTRDGLRIGYGEIIGIMKDFDNLSVVFRQTGGVHGCALGIGGVISIFHEDIGRHNAMDKVIGHGIKEGVDFSSSMAITSGRISSEMLIKAAKRKIPVVASRSAPTLLAVEFARHLNITLVGFVRGKRFNVYTGPDRIAGCDQQG